MRETQRVIGDGDVVHCKRAAYDVYVGRGRCPRTGQPGEWGNPFVLGSDGDRVAVIAKYRAWLLAQPALVEKARRELAGKVLACWCAPQSCHGDVLAEVANSEACEGCGSTATREDAAGVALCGACYAVAPLAPSATPTPAVADALARAEEGGRLAGAATRGPWEQRQRAVIGPAIMGGGERVCRTSEWRHETSQADAAFIAWCRANVPLMREDVRALAGQLARAEGRDEYAIALQRLCEWAAALMRGESREMPAGSLDASPHLARLLADAASALDAARARLAAAERVAEPARIRSDLLYRCVHGVAPFPCASCRETCERVSRAEVMAAPAVPVGDGAREYGCPRPIYLQMLTYEGAAAKAEGARLKIAGAQDAPAADVDAWAQAADRMVRERHTLIRMIADALATPAPDATEARGDG